MNIKQKLSSRKFWAAVIGVIMGIAMVFGLDEGTIENVSGAVVSVASIITYILSEGRIDTAACAGSGMQTQPQTDAAERQAITGPTEKIADNVGSASPGKGQ